MQQNLIEARIAASEEARLRLKKLDAAWTAERLSAFVQNILKDRTIFVVSNREPYVHTRTNGNIQNYVPASRYGYSYRTPHERDRRDVDCPGNRQRR